MDLQRYSRMLSLKRVIQNLTMLVILTMLRMLEIINLAYRLSPLLLMLILAVTH